MYPDENPGASATDKLSLPLLRRRSAGRDPRLHPPDEVVPVADDERAPVATSIARRCVPVDPPVVHGGHFVLAIIIGLSIVRLIAAGHSENDRGHEHN